MKHVNFQNLIECVNQLCSSIPHHILQTITASNNRNRVDKPIRIAQGASSKVLRAVCTQPGPLVPVTVITQFSNCSVAEVRGTVIIQF